jgi:hypothetical protein
LSPHDAVSAGIATSAMRRREVARFSFMRFA